MKVVLLDNIKGIGTVGHVKEVNDGYARNFLFPKGLAKPATPGVLKEAEALKVKKLEALRLVREEAEEVAKKLDGATVIVPGRANEQGTLFSAIGAAEIAEAASATAGVKLDPSQVKLDEPLKTAGTHEITLKFVDDITATVTIDVQTS